MKKCIRCLKIKPLEEFNSSKTYTYAYCRFCVKKYAKEYEAKNKDAIAIRKKAYYLKNREKILSQQKQYKKDFPLVQAKAGQKRRITKMSNDTRYIKNSELNALRNSCCYYCGSYVDISIDHVIPVSRGGRHSIGNLVAACKPCNSSKNNRTVMEWRVYKMKQNGYLPKTKETLP